MVASGISPKKKSLIQYFWAHQRIHFCQSDFFLNSERTLKVQRVGFLTMFKSIYVGGLFLILQENPRKTVRSIGVVVTFSTGMVLETFCTSIVFPLFRTFPTCAP